MRRRIAAVVLAAGFGWSLHAPLAAQTPRDLVARAVTAMGGEAALRGVRGISVDFYTATFALGQEETPESPARANFAIGQTLTDYAGNRQLGAIELRTVAGAVNRLRRVTAGGIGMLETNGRQAPDNPGAVANAEGGMRRAFERLLITALDNPATVTALPPRTWRGERYAGVRYANGPDTLGVYFDRRSALPTVTEVVTDDPILGDRHTVAWYTRWQPSGDILYPRQYDVMVNGRPQTNSVFTAVTVNPATADTQFAIPDSIAARAQRPSPTPAPITVNLVELGPGVWRAEGGSHHSLVVDQGTRLVVVEAPQSATRIEAVLDTLRGRFPGKPVGLAVNTHHHWDHAGGLRGALAAGVPVVTHARNAAFVQSVAAARKTVKPDALARRLGPARARVPSITAVEDSMVLGSGEQRVVVYRLPTVHVEGMLAAYLPASRILFVSDVLSPGPTMPAAGAREVAAFIKARGIPVERVAGGHGGVAAWADVERAATAP